jgi:hypothetical protein
MKEPGSPVLDRGGAIHTLAEQYTMNKIKACPPELAKFKTQFAALRKTKGVLCEQEWAFDAQWNKVGWFDGAAWLRIKMDVHYLTTLESVHGLNHTCVVVVDHKTGRVYDDHAEQRSLYALGAFLVYPDAELVEVQNFYLDNGEFTNETYTASMVPRLKKEWLARARPMLQDTRFKPTPGQVCRYCHFSKARNGPCQF